MAQAEEVPTIASRSVLTSPSEPRHTSLSLNSAVDTWEGEEVDQTTKDKKHPEQQ